MPPMGDRSFIAGIGLQAVLVLEITNSKVVWVSSSIPVCKEVCKGLVPLQVRLPYKAFL